MGGYHDESEFNGLELWAYQNIFLNQGPFPTAEGQVSIQAGSALGGGTVLNWTNCLRTTDHVRGEWAEHGLEGIDGSDYDAHMDAVWERLGVTGECSDLNGPHRLLQKGCEALGLDFRGITRNTDPTTYDPVTAGYLGFGDQSGSKRSTAKTYLADAAADEADFLVHCRVERVIVENGRAAGVEAVYLDPEGRSAKVTVRAPTVVVACGSVESPGLLLRSEIGGPAAGNYLRLHPTSVVFGYHEEQQDPWWGPPQAGLSHEFAELRRRPWLPDRVRPAHDRADRGGASVALRPRSQARGVEVLPQRRLHQPDPRSRSRARDHRRRRPARPSLRSQRRARHRQPPSGAGGDVADHGGKWGGGDAGAQSAGPDLAAAGTISRSSSPRSGRSRSPPGRSVCSAPIRWGVAAWAPIRRPRLPDRGANFTTPPASGSGMRAPSRPHPERTRCSP